MVIHGNVSRNAIELSRDVTPDNIECQFVCRELVFLLRTRANARKIKIVAGLSGASCSGLRSLGGRVRC